MVADTAAALTELGRLARATLEGEVVGITGSVGKTTTKDLAGHAPGLDLPHRGQRPLLQQRVRCAADLVNAPDDAQWVVLEMGARGAGHIASLAGLGPAHVGIVTSVAMAHIEFFGDLEGVVRAKGELVASLPHAGVAVLNTDDPRVARMAELARCPVLTFGIEAPADVRAEAVVARTMISRPASRCRRVGEASCPLRLHGAVQVPNALAAAAAALWCGVPIDAVAQALSEVTALDLAHGRAPSRTGAGADRRLLQRQPGVDRSGVAVVGRLGHGAQGGAARPHGRAG